MSLAIKLDLTEGELRVIGKPPEMELDVPSTAGEGQGVLVFVRALAEVGRKCMPAIEAAKGGKLAWVAYPKEGRLNTDLNPDILGQHLQNHGARTVGRVELDDVWDALRVRAG